MAIYHMEAKVISRGAGRSAVAAAAYMSCSRILNEYDGILHDYSRKKGLIWQKIFLPENAPVLWHERSLLWNVVEESEKAKDSRLAREIVVALPMELNPSQWQELLSEFIQVQFVSDGMCADVAVHDTDGHNPHAHIMLTVRPFDEQGKWQYKTEKEYLCVKGDEEKGFTAKEFKAAQHEGWEKQYPFKVGKKKVYMAPSFAEKHGYERASKYPKSTKYGRQNPISERWNSDEQLLIWREKWAAVTNKYLKQFSKTDDRIDHRSHAERGLSEQPTIHEGVTARAMEAKGILSDRCEINRQIKADNALLRELKASVKKLVQAVKNSVPVLAEAMESLRENMIILRYQFLHVGVHKRRMSKHIKSVMPELVRYAELVQQIKGKTKERKKLLTEKKETPIYRIPKLRDLSRRIAELTEELEELKSEKDMILSTLNCVNDTGISAVRKDISATENILKKLTKQEEQYSAELNKALRQYSELKEQAVSIDKVDLYEARMSIRPEKERSAITRIENAIGSGYDLFLMHECREDIADLLNENEEKASVQNILGKKKNLAKSKSLIKLKDRKQER